MPETLDTTIDEIETTGTEAPPAVVACQHCPAAAVLCETHAAALVAQAFSEERANRREGATAAAERALRKGDTNATLSEDATALRQVLVRWWGDEAGALARLIVAQLETQP